ncbi:conserved hypothetical protein [Neospora caninum Liverpool]|uniref:Transmembrane protein n=1 Tax=Neospora caninum (strain Liverpool) TaxID=572307 RepID=F0V757_NEOCL|nr:conserved hypothetical protein [Neospora caninum Liverpool]CBZ49548.1 conserved hypothetical protein [Neospora caninum Liverpool]|eukprot:XP_003879583.1 conserved hypothetical protein [Neospora caninum Liverpool]
MTKGRSIERLSCQGVYPATDYGVGQASMTAERVVGWARAAKAATPRRLVAISVTLLCCSLTTVCAFNLLEHVAAVIGDARGQALTLDNDPAGLAELLFRYDATIASLSGDSASPVSPEEAKTRITDLLLNGRWRLPYPRTYRVIDALMKDFVEMRTGSGRPWWMETPPSRGKRRMSPVPFGVTKRGWETCKRRNLKGFAVGRTLPEVLDDLQVQMQALVETVLVGEFGVCGPFFLKQKWNQDFDCVDTKNQDVLFPQYFVPTTSARHVRVRAQDHPDLNCLANCEGGGDAISERRVWEAVARGSLADDPASGRLEYSPLLPAAKETTLSRLLFSLLPDWSQFKNGSADQTDVQAVLSVAQEFAELLNAFYAEVFVANGQGSDPEATRPTPGKFHARSILALFDELEMNFCSWAKAQGWMRAEGQKRRLQVADWLSLRDIRDMPVPYHTLAGIAIQALDFLTTTSGSPWAPSAWWQRTETDLAVHPLSDVSAYHSGSRRLAEVSRRFIHSFLAPLPTALRATVLALVGRWAAEWAKEATLPADRGLADPAPASDGTEKYFDFSDGSGRAPKLLFLTTLVGGRSPAEAAAQSILEAFRNGYGAHLSGILARYAKKSRAKVTYLPIGRVVHVGACPTGGPGMWTAFSDSAGLASGSLSLSRSSLLRAFELIAASSWNALAPLAAAASVLEQIKELVAELEGATDSASPRALLEMRLMRSKFGKGYHCAVAKRELARFLRRSRARTEEELDALVRGTVVEVAYEEPLTSTRPAGGREDSSPLLPPGEGLVERTRLYMSCSFATDPQERNAFIKFVMTRRNVGRLWRGIRGFFRGVKRRVLRYFRRPVQAVTQPEGEAPSCVTIEQPPTSVIPVTIRQVQPASSWRVDALTHLRLPRSYGPYLFSLLHDLPSMNRPFDLRVAGQISGNNLVLATDVDDTFISSGGWRVRRPAAYLGGADTSYSRGTGYPGMGPLYYLLTLGSGKHGDKALPSPEPLSSPTPSTASTGTESPLSPFLAPQEAEPPLAKEPSRVLPLIMLTARLSLKLLRPIFRPKSLYAQMARLYDYGVAMITRSRQVAQNDLVMENPQPILTALRGKNLRGLNKVKGIEIYMRQAADGTADPSLPLTPATKFLFSGDTFERDLEACIVLGMRHPKSFVTCLMHIVFDTSEAGGARQGAVPPTFGGPGFRDAEELPPHVALFNLESHIPKATPNMSPNFTAGREGAFSGALGAAVRYAVRLPPEALPSWGDASCEQVRLDYAWQAAEQVAARLRRLLNTFRFTWKRDNLANILELESTTPLVFLRCSHIEKAEPGEGPGVRFLPVDEPSPFAGPVLDSEGRVISEALGLPISMYRTAVGAALHARYLNLIDQTDMSNLTVATIRQQRNIGPPASSTREDQWTELLADLRLQQMLFGDVSPAAFLASHAFAVNSSLSETIGQRLRNVACRAQQEETFELFSKLFRSTFPVGDAYEAALTTAWNAWSRAARFYCLYEPQFLHLCTAGQAEVEYLAHSVAQVTPFIEPEPSTTADEMCQMRGEDGEVSKTAYEPVLLGLLARLCLSNLEACRNLLAHLQDIGKLAQWRAEISSFSPTGPGLMLDSFGMVAYPDPDPSGGLGRRHRLPAILKPMVRAPPAEQQPTWPRLYKPNQWAETATVWKQLDFCLITPLQRLATRTVQDMVSRRWGLQGVSLEATAPELAYPKSPIGNPALLLQAIGAGRFKPSLGTESAESVVDRPGPQRGIVAAVEHDFQRVINMERRHAMSGRDG